MISNLEDFRAYNLAMEIGEIIWNQVKGWGYFEKDTVGKQLVRFADSVAANLAEGFGRYHFKEAKNFAYFSRGSLQETKSWLTKAVSRNLISKEEFADLILKVETLSRMLNSYIGSIGSVAEPLENYLSDDENLSTNL